MELVRLLGIPQEEHLVGYRIESIADAEGLRVSPPGKDTFDLPLGITVGLQDDVVSLGLCQVRALDDFCLLPKELREEAAVDVRRREALFVKRQSILFNLFTREGERGVEVPTESLRVVHGDLPDAEEAQYVVYAEAVEVVGQLLEPLLPPAKAVSLECRPVVGREVPVLAVHREVIRRCTCLTAHIEVLRLGPSLDTVSTHTDRQVSLQDNALLVGKL